MRAFEYHHDTNTLSFNGVIFHYQKNIGSGSFGSVDLFESQNATQKLALKSEVTNNGNYRHGKSFFAEAQWYQKIYGFGFFSGNAYDRTTPHYVLMPYFEGQTILNCDFHSLKALSIAWIDTANALYQIHTTQHATHCDIKSDNIIVGEKTRLIDFGLMKQIGENRDNMFEDCDEDRNDFWHQPPEVFTENQRKIPAHPTQDLFGLGMLLQSLYRLYLMRNDAIFLIENPVITQLTLQLIGENPIERISIPQAIYYLCLSFSTLPKTIPMLLKKIIPIEKKPLLTQIFQETSIALIDARLEKLIDENNEKESLTKKKKIKGLKALRSEIVSHDPDLFSSIIEKTQRYHPCLTSGFFQNRTKTLVNELSEMARICH